MHSGSLFQATSATDMTQLVTAIADWVWTGTTSVYYVQATSLVALTFTQGGTETDAFFTPPTASMSAFRGRGGFGSTAGQYVT